LAHIGYQCPRCHSHTHPIIESRISTAGWIVFAVMLFFCFPLFWIGFFITEDYSVCPMCRCRLN
jgi:hypothetical protein